MAMAMAAGTVWRSMDLPSVWVWRITATCRYFVQGALNRDYTLVLGVVLVIGAAIVVINTLVDALRVAMDPRLRDT